MGLQMKITSKPGFEMTKDEIDQYNYDMALTERIDNKEPTEEKQLDLLRVN